MEASLQAIWTIMQNESARVVLDWFGTLLGLGGVAATFFQARTARKAAEAAKVAVQNYKSGVYISNAATCRTQIALLKKKIRNDELEYFEDIFSFFKRDMYFVINSIAQEKITETNRVKELMGDIQKLIDNDRPIESKRSKIGVALNEIDKLILEIQVWQTDNGSSK